MDANLRAVFMLPGYISRTAQCEPAPAARIQTRRCLFVIIMPTPSFHPIISDDDDSSIDTLPGEVWTEERLAELEKYHQERTDGMYLTGRIIWPRTSPKRLKRQRTRHMLVGLANPFPDHGLKRSPTGRVRSWRLEAQRKKEAASNPP
jgi:hypothetical protein